MLRERATFEHETAWLDLDRETGPVVAQSLPPACTQPSPWPDADCKASTPSPETQRRRIAALCGVIFHGITRTAAHSPQTLPGPGLFAGSWDWHSCVHAHWALLAIARITGDAMLEIWLDGRLSDKALRAERDFLRKKADFELPYGRAWLLLMLAELGRRSRPPKEAAALERDTQDAVLGWLETSKYPENDADPRFVSTHKSWLFAYLLFVLSDPKPADARKRLRALRAKKLEPARKALAAAKHGVDPGDFLYLPAVQAVIDRVDPATTGKPAPYPVGVSPPLEDPPLDAGNAHGAGAALVRIWPHAIDAHAGDAKACSRFHARMSELFSRPDHWADSFELVAHWVPQFMWMALWLGAGRP